MSECHKSYFVREYALDVEIEAVCDDLVAIGDVPDDDPGAGRQLLSDRRVEDDRDAVLRGATQDLVELGYDEHSLA